MTKTQELIIISQVYYNGFGCYIFRSLLWNQSQVLRSVNSIKIKSIFIFSHGAQLTQWLHSCRFPSSQPTTTVGLKFPLPWQQDFLILSNQKLIHEQIRLINQPWRSKVCNANSHTQPSANSPLWRLHLATENSLLVHSWPLLALKDKPNTWATSWSCKRKKKKKRGLLSAIAIQVSTCSRHLTAVNFRRCTENCRCCVRRSRCRLRQPPRQTDGETEGGREQTRSQ